MHWPQFAMFSHTNAVSKTDCNAKNNNRMAILLIWLWGQPEDFFEVFFFFLGCFFPRNFQQGMADFREPKREYEIWPGKNRFCFGGRLMTGPWSDCGPNTCVWSIILIPVGGFFWFVGPKLWLRVPILVVVVFTFAVWTLIALIMTGFSDPGIIPRQSRIDAWRQVGLLVLLLTWWLLILVLTCWWLTWCWLLVVELCGGGCLRPQQPKLFVLQVLQARGGEQRVEDIDPGAILPATISLMLDGELVSHRYCR